MLGCSPPRASHPPRPSQMQELCPAPAQAGSMSTLTLHLLWTHDSYHRPSLQTRTPSAGWRSAWSCICRTRLSHTSGSDAVGDNVQKDIFSHKPRSLLGSHWLYHLTPARLSQGCSKQESASSREDEGKQARTSEQMGDEGGNLFFFPSFTTWGKQQLIISMGTRKWQIKHYPG